MHLTSRVALKRRLAAEDGFTMIFALLALFIGGLLMAAAFTAANGDIKSTHRATVQSKAYYAAVAGVDRYQYQLTSTPEYWTKCSALGSEAEPLKVPGTTDESYSVKTLGSTGNTCESGKQATILETTGQAKGTFRILSTGTVKEGSSTVTRKIVATFSHPGFTKYVYESNYEVEDPVNFGVTASTCEHYYAYRKEHSLTGTCPPIEFAPEDEVKGSMHTNDAAEVCNSPKFGREGYEDDIEMNGGHYAAGGCANTPNIIGKYTETAGSLLPPKTDAELLEAAGVKYSGRTEIELKSGNPNTMKVTNKGTTSTVLFPSNGVVYVENSKTEACGVTNYTPFDADTTGDKGCGNVYVHGTYTESLTIASADDVIVNGNLTTTEEKGEPSGSGLLGLIAENFVRVYHPVEESYEVKHYKPETQAPVGTECLSETQLSAKVTKNSAIVKVSSTSSLEKGEKVSGTGIPTGTTIKAVKNSTEIELSKEATVTSNPTTLTFTGPSGLTYFSGIKKCVASPESGYTFHESEELDAKSCNKFEYERNKFVQEEYLSGGKCEFYNGSKGCDAENDTAANDPNKWGSLSKPTIDAAILSTNHSWIVDNYKCGEKLGTLTVWGSIAQFWRGPVGQASGSGYIKNYNYDNRLASQQPPSFLSPTNATSWKISRETAAPATFTG